jgi:hypothetical protein
MIYPVTRGIWGEGKMIYGVSVDFVIELEEDTEASLRKHDMRWFGENVII